MLIKVKPTSPGRRGLVKVVTPGLHKGKPVANLVERQSKTAGRNAHGRVTMRHKGGGHKQHYRTVDFKRAKDVIPAKVERIEYDPNRSAHLALLCYADGERRYVIATRGMAAGMQVVSGPEAPIKPGNALPLRNIPVGTTICCVEMLPGKGAQIARAAGTSVQLLAREGEYAQLRLRSGEIRKVHVNCRATVGEVGNEEHSLESIGKAGRVRWRGIRPTVRGVAMNPIDHPHGGGEGRTAAAQAPVSPWGVMCKGYKTRKNKRTSGMIIRRRNAKATA
ncbi:MAG: 50S ribosomal protein L2 [Burkholderiales bacterium]|nr:50S ribosomal protein L2 [Burkholderiales bacterium]MCW5575383.1 50S ribosomal protein L2 [Burkholderiales bacterium]